MVVNPLKKLESMEYIYALCLFQYKRSSGTYAHEQPFPSEIDSTVEGTSVCVSSLEQERALR